MLTKEIIICGTGSSGNFFLKDVAEYNQICDEYNLLSEKITVKCCMDTRKERIGGTFSGYEVIDVERVKSPSVLKNVLFVIATAEYYEQIAEKLERENLVFNVDFVDFRDFFLKRVEENIQQEKRLLFCNEIMNKLIFINVEEAEIQSIKCKIGIALTKAKAIEKEDVKIWNGGVGNLVESFNLGYEKKNIKTFFDDFFYQPIVTQMQVYYKENQKIIDRLYHINFPMRMEEFHFTFYLLPEKRWCCFNKMEQRFIFYEEDEVRRTVSKYDILYQIFTEKLSNTYDVSIYEALKKLADDITSYEIFQMVSAKVNQKEPLDEKDREMIEQYHKIKPFADGYYWMIGNYYCERKAYDLALEILQEGLFYNPYSRLIYFLKGEIHFAVESWRESASCYLMVDFKRLKIRASMSIDVFSRITPEIKNKLMLVIENARRKSEKELKDVLKELSDVMSFGRGFPWYNRLFFTEAGSLAIKNTIAVDEPLTHNETQYFLGVEGNHYQKSLVFSELQEISQKLLYTPVSSMYLYSILEGQLSKEVTVSQQCLLPIMTKQQYPTLRFVYGNETFNYGVGDNAINEKYNRFIPYKPEYIRLEKQVEINANEELIVGKPILLEHSKKRKKLVLNLLIDNLSWMALKKNPELMPNTMKFFSKGLIFNQAYSAGEWTIPVLPTIVSGCYQEKTGFYHAEVPKMKQLPSCFTTTAQHMNAKGYYCINLSAVLHGFAYTDIYRGFHKSIGSRDAGADIFVMQCLNHLRALEETDLFVNMHVLDIHDAGSVQNNKMNVYTQNEIGRLLRNDQVIGKAKSSVGVVYDEFVYDVYTAGMQNTDGNLGILFDYITSHYDEDEYVVILHADHGSGCVDTDEFVLNEAHTNIPLMIRGADIPVGMVTDEMVSGIDLYAIYSHLCGYEIDKSLDCLLPRAFGGKGRDYVVGSSPYLGKTYKFVLRDADYEFRLETLDKVDPYGNVNMDVFSYEILSRNDKRRCVNDPDLEKRFVEIAREHAKYILK